MIICGDALTELRKLPDESVNMCVTSPPYWGLRDYGTAKWDGGDPDCDHKAGRFERGGLSSKQASNNGSCGDEATGICPKCGASRIDSQLGLEKTPEEYVAHLVEVFREVRRVLRKDGTLWLNLGDSYASQPAGNKIPSGFSQTRPSRRTGDGNQETVRLPQKRFGLKPKDLVGIPWRVAFALQADGWWLRQDIIWAKPNPMPESVRDRCTKAHEYIFMLSKSARYYYDAEAIREAVNPNNSGVIGGVRARTASGPLGGENKQNEIRREYDEIKGANLRSVWTIATRPYAEAHFATFPPEIPERCIKAGCPKGGTVLDPFFGAGTMGMVAMRLGREFIGIELNEKYCEMAKKRIYGELMEATP
jgi:DNA modification methylase